MLIPLHDGRLVLPNAAVAEIIGYRDPDAAPVNAPWLQGKVSWRQRQVPVVDFERLLGNAPRAAGIRQRIAVCYAPQTDQHWPLIGVVSQGIPRLLRINRDIVESATAGPAGESAIKMRISIAGERLIVPDLSFLQASLHAA